MWNNKHSRQNKIESKLKQHTHTHTHTRTHARTHAHARTHTHTHRYTHLIFFTTISLVANKHNKTIHYRPSLLLLRMPTIRNTPSVDPALRVWRRTPIPLDSACSNLHDTQRRCTPFRFQTRTHARTHT